VVAAAGAVIGVAVVVVAAEVEDTGNDANHVT
jgi:hypothetical protein